MDHTASTVIPSWLTAQESAPITSDAAQELQRELLNWSESPKDSGARKRADEAAWVFLKQCFTALCHEDIERDAPEVGSWTLSSGLRLFVESGYVSHTFYQDDLQESDLVQSLESAFAPLDFNPPFRIESLTPYLRRHYRETLGIEALLARDDHSKEIRQKIEMERSTLKEESTRLMDILVEDRDSEAITAQLIKWLELLPQIALITRRQRIGRIEAQERRLHMKVFEAARRLIQVIEDSITQYERRKRFTDLQKQVINQCIAIQELEDELKSVQGPARVQLDRDQCEAAIAKGVDQLLAFGRVLSKVPSEAHPPLILEHTPRVTPALLAETIGKIRECSPNLFAGECEFEFPILLLPGVGNAFFDPKSSVVVASVFPIEVRITSLVGSIGELILHRYPNLQTDYARLKKVSSREKGKLSEMFSREFALWNSDERGSRRSLETATIKWFETHLGT